jgi:hypothetical protein
MDHPVEFRINYIYISRMNFYCEWVRWPKPVKQKRNCLCSVDTTDFIDVADSGCSVIALDNIQQSSILYNCDSVSH